MAFTTINLSLNEWANKLMPALRAETQDASANVVDCAIWTDFAGDRLRLSVSYHLFSRHELEDSPYKIGEKFRQRIFSILQIPKKIPKQITIERRRMLWRGECARKAKVKKK